VLPIEPSDDPVLFACADAYRAIVGALDRAVHLDVAVDHVGDELRYLTFIDAARLRVIGRNVEPPPVVDVDEGICVTFGARRSSAR
jgi:hypothetical protein